jgi:hypothetical protein
MKYQKKNSNVDPGDCEKKITNIYFKRIEEALLSQHHWLEAQSSQVDRHSDPKRYADLDFMAQRVLELWEAVTECAEEYEVMDIKMLMEGDA